jgi:hypothetical protein
MASSIRAVSPAPTKAFWGNCHLPRCAEAGHGWRRRLGCGDPESREATERTLTRVPFFTSRLSIPVLARQLHERAHVFELYVGLTDAEEDLLGNAVLAEPE